MIIEICFKAINAANLSVNGYVISAYDEDSKKHIIHNTKLALVEIEKLEKVFSMHDKMYEFMRETNPHDLFALVCSQMEDEK